jgi:putative hemolysin
MASTVGGIVAVESIKPMLAGLPWPAVRHAAEPLAVMTVVAAVSYTSLIIGELVPKAIGLQYADSIALHVARPLTLVSRIASIAVTILTVSSKTVLRLLHIATERERLSPAKSCSTCVRGGGTGRDQSGERKHTSAMYSSLPIPVCGR